MCRTLLRSIVNCGSACPIDPPEVTALIAFGDPLYRTERRKSPDAILRSAAKLGDLRPLPWSRLEVEEIGRLYPRSSIIFLGDEASEENAKALDIEPNYLHFAAHSIPNDRFPLDSAIALTASPGIVSENGLLQVWEVFESVRLDADLVTLSACQTALGPEVGGEGMLGLTRAFHYAGARSVLSSLWEVADKSTGLLMTEFYSALRSGLDKDRALQQAQLAMLNGDVEMPGRCASRLAFINALCDWAGGEKSAPAMRHPFHWAAFTLNGLAD